MITVLKFKLIQENSLYGHQPLRKLESYKVRSLNLEDFFFVKHNRSSQNPADSNLFKALFSYCLPASEIVVVDRLRGEIVCREGRGSREGPGDSRPSSSPKQTRRPTKPPSSCYPVTLPHCTTTHQISWLCYCRLPPLLKYQRLVINK